MKVKFSTKVKTKRKFRFGVSLEKAILMKDEEDETARWEVKQNY